MPGLLKIGKTKNHPAFRADQLYTTGVPTKFKIEYAQWAEDRHEAEANVHEELRDYWYEKEFFGISPHRERRETQGGGAQAPLRATGSRHGAVGTRTRGEVPQALHGQGTQPGGADHRMDKTRPIVGKKNYETNNIPSKSGERGSK